MPFLDSRFGLPKACSRHPAFCLRWISIPIWKVSNNTITIAVPIVNGFHNPFIKSPGFMNAPIRIRIPQNVILCIGIRQALQRESWLAYSPPTPSNPNQPPSMRAVNGVKVQGQKEITVCGEMNINSAMATPRIPEAKKAHFARAGTVRSSDSGVPGSVTRFLIHR